MAVKVGAATPRAQTILAWLAGLAVLYWAKAILIPIALSVLLTFLLAPLVNRFQRLGIPKVLAVAIVVVVGFMSAGGVARPEDRGRAVGATAVGKAAGRASRQRRDVRRAYACGDTGACRLDGAAPARHG